MEGHKGHRKRMKEEFLQGGLDHMQPHRVLEMLLFYAIPQGDTNELAHRLIERFGSLTGVLDASCDELMDVSGIGSHAAVLIHFISALARYYYTEKANINPVKDPLKNIAQKMVAQYVGYTEERLILVCLDNTLKELFFGMVKVGVADAVQLQFRDLAKIALRYDATNVILGHNHPNGMALPSRADRETTIEIARGFRDLGINLLDHIIVAGAEYVSLAESGILAGMLRNDPPQEELWRR